MWVIINYNDICNLDEYMKFNLDEYIINADPLTFLRNKGIKLKQNNENNKWNNILIRDRIRHNVNNKQEKKVYFI